MPTASGGIPEGGAAALADAPVASRGFPRAPNATFVAKRVFAERGLLPVEQVPG